MGDTALPEHGIHWVHLSYRVHNILRLKMLFNLYNSF
jgi:hypothetical protein